LGVQSYNSACLWFVQEGYTEALAWLCYVRPNVLKRVELVVDLAFQRVCEQGQLRQAQRMYAQWPDCVRPFPLNFDQLHNLARDGHLPLLFWLVEVCPEKGRLIERVLPADADL